MHLDFLGTGSSFNYLLGTNSAYFIEKDKMFLIDCGDTTLTGILAKNVLKNIRELYFINTHMHPDHISSLGNLIFYTHYRLNFNVKILSGNKDREKDIKRFLLLQGISSEFYSFVDLTDVCTKFSNIVELKTFELSHSENIKNQALEIVTKDNTIYYSGDTNDLEYVKSVVLKLKTNDIFYCEAYSYIFPEMTHLFIDDLVNIVPEHKRKQVCIMHFDNVELITKALSLGFSCAK